MSYTKPSAPAPSITLVEGVGVDINNTNPNAPVITVDVSELTLPTPTPITLVQGTGITINNTNPSAPVISSSSAGLESIVAGANMSINSIDPLNPIISSVGGSGSSVVVETVNGVEGYSGAEQVIFTKDAFSGGTFTKSATALVADGGTIFTDANGNFWVRQFERSQGINVKWFGAKGDGVTDDLAAFNATTNYVTKNNGFMGDERFDRASIVIPDGVYVLSNTWIIGGRPVNETDALIYDAYNNLSGAPSYQLSEHIKGGSTLAVSLLFGDRAYLKPNFGVLTQLKSVLSYGCYSYSYGGFGNGSPKISGLKIISPVGFDPASFGADGAFIVGMVQYGNGSSFTMENCTFIGLQHGLIQNMCYFVNMKQMQFKRCGIGFTTFGSHASTGWMFQADHCNLGYDIKSGASSWEMFSTEQCKAGMKITGNNSTIHGIYFEQLAGTSGPEDYQIEIGIRGAANEINDQGVHIHEGVITAINNKNIRVNSNISSCELSNLLAYGEFYVESNLTSVRTNNVTAPIGNTANVILMTGGVVKSKKFLATGDITTPDLIATTSVTAPTVNAVDLTATGNTYANGDLRYKFNPLQVAKTKYITVGSGSNDVIICLGRTGASDNSILSGNIVFAGNIGGNVNIQYWNNAAGAYASGLASIGAQNSRVISLITYTYAGFNYYGLRFTAATGFYIPVGALFTGSISENGYTFTAVETSLVTAILPYVPSGAEKLQQLSGSMEFTGDITASNISAVGTLSSTGTATIGNQLIVTSGKLVLPTQLTPGFEMSGIAPINSIVIDDNFIWYKTSTGAWKKAALLAF